MSRTAADIVEIGRDLAAQKEALGHGNFLPWIEAEFGMSEWTARNFMNVAGLFAKSGSLPDLGREALYALAAPSTLETVRNEVQRRADAGDKVKASDVADLKRQVAAEKAALKEAKDDVKVHRSAAQDAKDDPARGRDHRARVGLRSIERREGRSMNAVLEYNGKLIREREEMLSLTDMWKASKSPEDKRPAEWARQQGAEFIAFLADALNVGSAHIYDTRRGRYGGGTWAHWQIAFAYAKHLSHEFHMWCNTIVREHLKRMREGAFPCKHRGFGADART